MLMSDKLIGNLILGWPSGWPRRGRHGAVPGGRGVTIHNLYGVPRFPRFHAAGRSDVVAVIWSAASSRRFVISRSDAVSFSSSAVTPLLLLLFSLRRYRSIKVSCSWRSTTRRRWGTVCRVRRRSATCKSGESSPHSKEGFAPSGAASVEAGLAGNLNLYGVPRLSDYTSRGL